MHQWCKFGENLSSTFLDIMLTRFGMHAVRDLQNYRRRKAMQLADYIWRMH